MDPFFWMAHLNWKGLCFYYWVMDLTLGNTNNLHIFFSFPLDIYFMNLGNLIWEFIKLQGWINSFGWLMWIEKNYITTTWSWIGHKGTIDNLHVFFSSPLEIYFICLENFIWRFIKVQGWAHSFGWLMWTEFFYDTTTWSWIWH